MDFQAAIFGVAGRGKSEPDGILLGGFYAGVRPGCAGGVLCESGFRAAVVPAGNAAVYGNSQYRSDDGMPVAAPVGPRMGYLPAGCSGRALYGCGLPQTAPVLWPDLQRLFVPDRAVLGQPMGEMEAPYRRICTLLDTGCARISPRTDRAVRCYWHAAQRLFVPEETPAGAAAEALDFAIAQRVVPKLFGNDAYTALLAQDLWQICMELDLQKSAQLVENMLQNGQIYDG